MWFAPPCAVRGPWTRLNDCGRPQELRRLRAKEKVLVEFVEEHARRQTAAGRHLIMESLEESAIWETRRMVNLAKEEPMNYCVTDTCAYGLKKYISDGMFFKKPTKLLTSHDKISKSLDRPQRTRGGWQRRLPRLRTSWITQSPAKTSLISRRQQCRTM